jgi:hypothetical protein
LDGVDFDGTRGFLYLNFVFHEDAAVVKRSFLVHGFTIWLRPDIWFRSAPAIPFSPQTPGRDSAYSGEE